MVVPHHLNPPPPPPPQREKDIPLSRVLVTIGNYNNKKSRAFLGNLPETTAKYTPFPEKMGIRMRPLMHSSGGGGGLISKKPGDWRLFSSSQRD